MVEFALVSILLFLLVFGIITYAFMMSFRQSMTQAAAEGARAAALAPAALVGARTDAALAQAVAGFDQTCGVGGLTCTPVVAPCTEDPGLDCVTVTLEYDYANNPLLPPLPLLSGLLPSRLSAQSVVEVSQVVTP